MSDPVWPHRWQPTRLPRPWDSQSKNTGVGCHFLLQYVKVKVKSLSPVWLVVIRWTAAYQAPPSMSFSRQEYWSGVPLPSPRIRAVLFYFLIFFFFLFFGHHAVCEILVPWLGIKPVPSSVEGWSLNHWTTREVPNNDNFKT